MEAGQYQYGRTTSWGACGGAYPRRPGGFAQGSYIPKTKVVKQKKGGKMKKTPPLWGGAQSHAWGLDLRTLGNLMTEGEGEKKTGGSGIYYANVVIARKGLTKEKETREGELTAARKEGTCREKGKRNLTGERIGYGSLADRDDGNGGEGK